MDEAAAKLRTEIDSMPTELDEIDPPVDATRDRAAGVEEGDRHRVEGPARTHRAGTRRHSGQRRRLTRTWQAEKAVGAARSARSASRSRRSSRDRTRRARLRPEQGRRAEVRPTARRLQDVGRGRNSRCRVQRAERCSRGSGEDDIAAVVSRWTGVPVTSLLEGESEKLLHLADELHERVVGQDEAVAGRGRGRGPRPRRIERPRQRPSAASCSSARPAWARPNSPELWPTSCSTTSEP